MCEQAASKMSSMRLQAVFHCMSVSVAMRPLVLPCNRISSLGFVSAYVPRALSCNFRKLQVYDPCYFPSSSSSSFSPCRITTAVSCSTLSQNSVEIESGVNGTGKQNNPVDWKIKMLYDGDCPLCMREVNMLKERSKKYGEVINFVDICARDYSPEENSNIDFETAMGRIHAIRRDGEVLTNIAAFRALYEEVGLGWVYAITYNQPWASIADSVYDFWAKYRLPITGRPPLAEVLEKRRQSKGDSDNSCDVNNRCRVD